MKKVRTAGEVLADIVETAYKAFAFVEGMSFEEFKDDEKTIFAVIRALEVVGEATKNVPKEIRQRAPEVPWRAVAGMRDKLIHDYIKVELGIVWATVREDLPDFVEKVAAILGEMGQDSGSTARPRSNSGYRSDPESAT